MKRLWQSAVIMFLVSDAVLLFWQGKRWVRFTRFGAPSGTYYQVMTWLLQWPEWLLRLSGAAEAVLALRLLERWQPREQGMPRN
ncbi:MAG TPA: hypothetical protein VK879_08855 [Candidatus Sulfomarinibacteraceae bacterium]|nr:hypothetical protein [Candidatus Sulfomarinibacteraceae bacterium]